MGRSAGRWFELIREGRNGASDPDVLHRPFPILPWLHPRLHPRLAGLMERIGVPRKLEPGESIFGPREPVDRLVMVTEGVTGRSLGDPYAQRGQSIAFSTPGHIAAGNLNFFTGRHAVGRYVAFTASEVVSCPRDLLKKIFLADRELGDLAVEQFECCSLSDRVGFACLSLLSAEQRLKAFLITWAANFGGFTEQAGTGGRWIRMPRPVTHEIICQTINATERWVNRIFGEWSKEGVWMRLGWNEVLVRPELLEDVYGWILQSNEGTCDYTYPETLAGLLGPWAGSAQEGSPAAGR